MARVAFQGGVCLDLTLEGCTKFISRSSDSKFHMSQSKELTFKAEKFYLVAEGPKHFKHTSKSMKLPSPDSRYKMAAYMTFRAS